MNEGTSWSKQVHYKSKQRSKSKEEWTKSWQFEQKKVDLSDLNKINTFEQNKSQQFGGRKNLTWYNNLTWNNKKKPQASKAIIRQNYHKSYFSTHLINIILKF